MYVNHESKSHVNENANRNCINIPPCIFHVNPCKRPVLGDFVTDKWFVKARNRHIIR